MKDWKTENELFYKRESEMFNLTADYYDKYRPSYPMEIIDELVTRTNISEGAELLEIGAGSGKATELLKDRGYNICCIEPGKDLVANGKAKFKNYPNIKYECKRFEDYDAQKNFFDVIYAAQAFHWVPQPIGYKRCAEALKSSGYLAPFWNMYITFDNDVDNELLQISRKYGGFADFLSEEECEKRISSIVSSIGESGLFEKPDVYRHMWKQSYTADEYYGFVLTGNSFIQKSHEEKENAHRDIVNLANKHGGVIERPYMCVLYISQRL